jgi:hypothetical protein
MLMILQVENAGMCTGWQKFCNKGWIINTNRCTKLVWTIILFVYEVC